MRRQRQPRWVRGLAMLAVMTASAMAAGQAPPQSAGGAAASATNPNVDLLKKHYAAGRAAADSKNWPKAVEEFSKAYALQPLPQLAGNLGEAELRIGRFRDAAEHIAKFLREDKGATADDKKDGEGWLAEAKKKIVTLKISVVDAGAEVLIDDKSIGTSPLPPEVYVEPGKHTVVARLGALRAEETDTYEAGWTRVITLVPKEPAAAGATAVPTASATASDAVVREQTGPNKTLVIGGLVVAGIALAAGGIFAGVSAAKGTDADSSRAAVANNLGGSPLKGYCVRNEDDPNCIALISSVDAQNAFATASLWSFVGAGVLAGVTAIYWFAPRKAAMGQEPVRAGAVVNGSGGRLILEGTW